MFGNLLLLLLLSLLLSMEGVQPGPQFALIAAMRTRRPTFSMNLYGKYTTSSGLGELKETTYPPFGPIA